MVVIRKKSRKLVFICRRKECALCHRTKNSKNGINVLTTFPLISLTGLGMNQHYHELRLRIPHVVTFPKCSHVISG